jgi:hypothetical protein
MREHATASVAIAVACLTLGPAITARQAPDLAAIVAQHYPQALVGEARDILEFQPEKEQCFTVLEASASGAPQVVVAGYTNMLSRSIRLLRAVDGVFVVAGEIEGDEPAARCEAEALDVDNDGRKEAVVHFLVTHASIDSVVGWDGSSLLQLSYGGLVNASFVDIDGDHVMEAFVSYVPPRDGPPEGNELYRLSGGRYVLERPIVAMITFDRASGTPERSYPATIVLPRGAVGPFTLRIVNLTRIESGQVWWNKREIISPRHFGRNVTAIDRTVQLEAENRLEVRLAGPPGGRIAVLIDAARWTP